MDNNEFKMKIIESLGRIEEKLTNTVTKEQCSEHRSCLKLSVYKLYFIGIGAIGVLGLIAKYKDVIF